MWCHNPEGQNFEAQYIKSENGCRHCGACMEAGARITGKPCLVSQSELVCPEHLVRHCGTDYTPEELVRYIDKKLWMLNNSGGGVTFSGGEPFSQPSFLLRCLHLLEGKTHRAIQTSGYTSASAFAEVLPHCDFMLYDLKLMDPKQHERYTGVDNKNIHENYQYLANSEKPFITRVPLIPGVTDTEENLSGIAAFMSALNVDRVELLPYNRAAGAKYLLVGRQYETDFNPAAQPQPHLEIFADHGIGVKVL